MPWTPPPPTLGLRYDPRLDDEFAHALLPGGELRSFVEFARCGYPVDLHFRRDWMSGAQHASLFVGLTRIVDIEYRRGQARVIPLRALRGDFGFDESWAEWTETSALWTPRLELFIDQAIPWAADGRGAMGANMSPRVHAASRSRWAISQAFSVQFRTKEIRRDIFASVTNDIHRALEPNPIAAFPNPLKLVASVLSVNADGALHVTEVQSRRASELPWAAGMMVANVRILRTWLETDPEAHSLLGDAVRTRVALGLLPASTPLPARGGKVVPVVQTQTGMSDRLRGHIHAVWERLAERGIAESEDLQLLEWSLSGRETVSTMTGGRLETCETSPRGAD